MSDRPVLPDDSKPVNAGGFIFGMILISVLMLGFTAYVNYLDGNIQNEDCLNEKVGTVTGLYPSQEEIEKCEEDKQLKSEALWGLHGMMIIVMIIIFALNLLNFLYIILRKKNDD